MAFFETSGRNPLAAEAAAGVGHHVALSVVGTDRLLASGYFRAKMAQEKLIKASPIPYTIVHATQFFEFVGGIRSMSGSMATFGSLFMIVFGGCIIFVAFLKKSGDRTHGG